ncbi:hypothetical protein [Pedobacter xixiisoli]|uniref:Outer membrane protein beta-barrel domain-containing protein n=1 Tax=Pedobacter xixiisoli TaxID=1476464 RepID=A0A286A7T4_9SPHI|nr:hypothetical protein [Pedobacter xixiisoli]SOD17972.1 hypothetical protein SAMN06297358_2761 [Pedobacter xixiisoli]
MKKLLFTLIAGAALFTINLSKANAQDYKTAAGLAIDFGDGRTLVGPHIKHFINANGALEGDILFADGATFIQGLYLYHGDIKGAQGLRWNLGAGPGVAIGNNNTNFLIRPNAGLDYKISGAPLGLGLDWRPAWQFFDGGNNFEAARFQIGFRYIFK